MANKSEIFLDGIKYVSKAGFAKSMGVTPETIYRACKDERIKKSLRQIGKQEMIDLEAARIEYQKNTDALQSSRRKKTIINPDDPDIETIGEIHKFNDERAKKEHFEARLSEIKLKEKLGELVSAEEVVSDAHEISQKIRNSILNIPKRVAPELAAINDAFEIEKYLDKEFRNVLEELSREFEDLIEVGGDEVSKIINDVKNLK